MMASSSGTTIDAISEHTLRGWRSLRLIGGIAALLAAIVFRRWLSAEFSLFQSLGLVPLQITPTTPLEWFTLLHTNRFVGLLLLNFFDIVNYGLAVLMYMGIYSLLKNHDKAYIQLSVLFAVIGTSIYFTSSQTMNITSLASQYFASVSEAQKQLILAAGQYALTANDSVVFGTGLFWSYMFFYSAGMLFSIVMLRNGPIGKWIAIIGIIANAFGLSYFFTSFLMPSLSIIPALGSAPTNLVWYIAVGIQLIRNAKWEA